MTLGPQQGLKQDCGSIVRLNSGSIVETEVVGSIARGCNKFLETLQWAGLRTWMELSHKVASGSTAITKFSSPVRRDKEQPQTWYRASSRACEVR